MTSGERRLVLWAFLFIIVVTFVSAILVGLGLFPQGDAGFFKWLLGTGIAEIAATVIWGFRSSLQQKGRVSVNIVSLLQKAPIMSP